MKCIGHAAFVGIKEKMYIFSWIDPTDHQLLFLLQVIQDSISSIYNNNA
jgi:hypothetical protein